MTAAPVLGLPARLTDACGVDPGVLCRSVLDTTHSQYLASGAEVLFATPLRIALVVLVALIVRRILHRAIRRLVARYLDDSTASWSAPLRTHAPQLLVDALDGLPGSERRQQRAETVGTLLRSIVSFIVFGVAFTTILGELGINLAPIVASAGIVGVAVGFGAQNLVRDFLTGIFMILEDQYGVGDVVDTGAVTGTVEDVTLRITRIRDGNGVVWYVRNGEILRIGNKSQGWSTAVVDIQVGYEEDLARVTRIITEVVADLGATEPWTSLLLEDPSVVGIEAMSGGSVTLRVSAKCVANESSAVQREIRERVKAVFDANGVVVPGPPPMPPYSGGVVATTP